MAGNSADVMMYSDGKNTLLENLKEHFGDYNIKLLRYGEFIK